MDASGWAAIFNGAATLLAFVAAGLWLWSAKAAIPRRVKRIDYGNITDEAKAADDDLDRTSDGIAIQSRRSAWGAIAAAAAAICQGVALQF